MKARCTDNEESWLTTRTDNFTYLTDSQRVQHRTTVTTMTRTLILHTTAGPTGHDHRDGSQWKGINTETEKTPKASTNISRMEGGTYLTLTSSSHADRRPTTCQNMTAIDDKNTTQTTNSSNTSHKRRHQHEVTFPSRINDRRTSGTVICLSAHPTQPMGFTSEIPQEIILSKWPLVTTYTVKWSRQTEGQHHHRRPSTARSTTRAHSLNITEKDIR
ncbi:hypothetical protein ACOMHN_044744 [Nucella lapillus]